MAQVLVVDDDIVVLRSLEAMGNRAGLSMRLAESGTKAVDAVGREAPDLVLLDMMMPEMDGMATLEALRAAGYEGPVIGMSVRQDLDGEMMARGASTILRKPVEWPLLYEAMVDLLGSP